MRRNSSVRTFLSEDDLALGAAQEFTRLVNTSIETRGICRVVLSGGETPRRLYRHLANDPYARSLDWRRVHVFFGDERVVPPTDPQSNYGMAHQEFLSHVEIPDRNIHRIFGELNPDEAARRYQQEIEQAFDHRDARFDLVLLGLGEDGHTASLFPGTSAILEEHLLACPVYIPRLEGWRVTLTFRTINNALRVVFLVAGGKKASILKRILATQQPESDLSAAMVSPRDGTILWMVDSAAAGQTKDLPAPSSKH